MMYVVAPTMEWAREWWRNWCQEHEHHPLHMQGTVRLFSANLPERMHGQRPEQGDEIIQVAEDHWPRSTYTEVRRNIRLWRITNGER